VKNDTNDSLSNVSPKGFPSMQTILRLFIVLLVGASATLSSFAAIINAASLSQSDVQAAINSAGPGDTVLLPAGSAIWSTLGDGVVINGVDQITIQGAGIDQTIIHDRLGHANPFTAVFRFNNYHIGAKSLRITGMTIVTDPTLYSSSSIGITSPQNFRIDHIKITQIVRRGILVAGAQGNTDIPRGVIDNCELYAPYNLSAQLITIQANDFNFPPSVASPVNGSWATSAGAGLGTANAVFVEDCILHMDFPNDASIETYSGGRCVLRNSQLHNFSIGAHGNDSSTRSGHTIELYNNTITNTYGSNQPYSINLRGGTAVMFNNTINWSGAGFLSTFPIQLQHYRGAGHNLSNGSPTVISMNTLAGNFVTGRVYRIVTPGSTSFTSIGAANNSAGTIFTATGPGSGTGTASNHAYVGRYAFNPSASRYERVGDTSKYFIFQGGVWALYGDGLRQLVHATDLRADQVVGNYSASGTGNITLSANAIVRIYNNNLANGSEPTDGNSPVLNGAGTHTGSNGTATLIDSTKSWSPNQMLGFGTADLGDELFSYYVWNRTTGAGGFVMGNDATTVSVTLRGGTRQTWNTGDTYVITNGYPALDQVGWSAPTVFTATYSTQVLNPVYCWNNTFNGAPDTRPFSISWLGQYNATNSPRIDEFIQEGREYFNNAGPKPGYSPFVYPHPLRAGGVFPPSVGRVNTLVQ
jgi:hypothetical protein